ncbi:glucan endo-1,3-beta-D-glucosidase 1-like [Phragmites australis]|uniref:glucan endo-1,3-beta-D-glucosidase 1-like n=1 Tax=Phragmites australis TaxID=29695 RepID=UPI002D77B5A6|nr:glucan endo-1,3-beta-D-glucosidase 1-like [Phragmites australis]
MWKWKKKLGHALCRFLTCKHPFTLAQPRPTPPVSIQPSPPPPPMPHHGDHRPPAPAPGGHVFPRAASTVLPDPARFFAPGLLAAPLPTNSFFQNFALKNGDQPEYIHPYSVRSPGAAALDVCYPARNHSPSFVIQTFVADLTISDAAGSGSQRHRIAAFDDLSVTLDVSPSLRAHLVRGCPYVTVTTAEGAGPVDISVSSVHAFIEVAPCGDTGTKWRLRMNSGQTFLLYASAPIRLAQAGTTQLSAPGFAGAIRVAYLPDASMELVLDRYSGCYPTAGEAALNRPFCVDYTWHKEGPGELLMLAHPLHLRLLADECAVRVLDDFRYRSIDGDLVGVVGDSWVLRTDPVSPTWHSARGVSKDGVDEVVAALRKDVDGLASTPIITTSSYFYGKAIARAARLALIAEEVGYPDAIPAVQRFLKATVTPWLDGSFLGNGFFYDSKWGGLVTLQGLKDSGADFGFGIYNDHHYHLGYFLYAIAVLAKIDPCWGRKYMPQAYSMVADFMTLSRKAGASFTRLRTFDLWKLHSWAGGLTEFADGRNQESTSEAVNAYYSAALLGLSYGDTHLVSVGATLTALEMLAAQTWWHVRAGEGIYEDDFSGNNRVVGVLWANKRDSGLWFAPPEWKECRLGIQLLPLLPISEALFPDIAFVKDLVSWTLPALSRDGVGEGWKGFVYALEGIYDKEAALAKTRALTGQDDGNTLTNLLWWLHSRGSVVGDGAAGFSRCCWYRQYCH